MLSLGVAPYCAIGVGEVELRHCCEELTVESCLSRGIVAQVNRVRACLEVNLKSLLSQKRNKNSAKYGNTFSEHPVSFQAERIDDMLRLWRMPLILHSRHGNRESGMLEGSMWSLYGTPSIYAREKRSPLLRD